MKTPWPGLPHQNLGSDNKNARGIFGIVNDAFTIPPNGDFLANARKSNYEKRRRDPDLNRDILAETTSLLTLSSDSVIPGLRNTGLCDHGKHNNDVENRVLFKAFCQRKS